MDSRYEQGPTEASRMSTSELRENFLVEDLMKTDQFSFLHTHYDRSVIGTAIPATIELELPNFDNMKSNYFLERRELGIINIGGPGEVILDDAVYQVGQLDAVYVGKGNKKVIFRSRFPENPAKYYLYSVPANKRYPNAFMRKEEASPIELGQIETANRRTIYKYIHQDGIPSCQLVMGVTVLSPGSTWNTMPAHTHDRRMETYFYFDLPSDQVIFHLMGQPWATRHLVTQNHQAIISPPWSIHSGVGTSNYSFVWAMAGENQDFTDMDPVKITDLR